MITENTISKDMIPLKLFCGQYFINTLHVIEFFQKLMLQANRDKSGYDRKEWLERLEKLNNDENTGAIEGDSSPRNGKKGWYSKGRYNKFSFVKLAQLDEEGYASTRLQNYSDKLFSPKIFVNGKVNIGELEIEISKKMVNLVKYATQTSGFFNNHVVMYYLFSQWHYIELSFLKELGIELTEDERQSISKLCTCQIMESTLTETKEVIDRYFETYARLISDPDIVRKMLQFEYDSDKNIRGLKIERINAKLFKQLYKLAECFYTRKMLSAKVASVCESPQIFPDNKDITLYQASMSMLFGEKYEQIEIANKVLTAIKAADGTKDLAERFEEVTNRLHTATLVSEKGKFLSNIFEYKESVKTWHDPSGTFPMVLPYFPIIDSTAEQTFKNMDFTFTRIDELYNANQFINPFQDQISILYNKEKAKAKANGYDNTTSEEKLCLIRGQIESSSSTAHVFFDIGHIDYFTGVARRNLFTDFLLPTENNLNRNVLPFLLENNSLVQFLENSKAAIKLQAQYNKRERLSDDGQHAVIDHLKTTILDLYSKYVKSNSLVVLSDKALEISGGSFAGCGTFILTGDRKDGIRYPLLLLEQRYMVSEKANNLCYPSAGSCDYYSSDIYPYIYKSSKGAELLKNRSNELTLEANPFLTSKREMFEELAIFAQIDEIELISFGIDQDRLLQQFSFLYQTDKTAAEIMRYAQDAETPNEGKTFAIPFSKNVIQLVLENYVLEPGAVYSLIKLMELKSELLWENIHK